MKSFKLLGQFLAIISGLLFFIGCQQESVSPDNAQIEERGSTTTVAYYPSVGFYALSTSNMIYTYRSGPPATIISKAQVTGLGDGEVLLAIDVRPATRVLYGVTNMNNIYSIRVSSGLASATKVSQVPFKPGIQGTTIGFDFNPTTDKISLITNANQNLKIDPVTGQVLSSDGYIKIPVTGSAYWGSTLYDIESSEGKLYRQDPASGFLTYVGSTGLSIKGDGGFDISSNGQALAVFMAGTTTDASPMTPAYRLYNINLKTGQATNFGEVYPIIGIAIQ
ncbi:MAG TPA: DUF4394 domain-containing protein [Saprospiraceae bacterium]|nr:DUF4394 domain-containing protein [Saprospiraceae bacterium]